MTRLSFALAVVLSALSCGSGPQGQSLPSPESAELLWEREEAKRRDNPAHRLLSMQRDRNRDVVAELGRRRDRNDMAGFRAVLGARAVELDAIIAVVETDYETYSIGDKRNILKALTEERDWARSSYLGLRALDQN